MDMMIIAVLTRFYNSILEEIQAGLNMQAKQNMLEDLLHKGRDKERIKAWSNRIEHVMHLLKVCDQQIHGQCLLVSRLPQKLLQAFLLRYLWSL